MRCALADDAAPPASGEAAARYTLQPGLQLIADDTPQHGQLRGGGILFSVRPLMAMRLNAQAFSLLSHLTAQRSAREAAALVPGLHPLDAAEFLDTLAERRVLAKQPSLTGPWPLVSIIVAARGRHAATRACVDSLLALDYPRDRTEILVVDDASEPPLAPVLSDLPVRLLRQDRNIGQSAARNLAAAEAGGDILAFIDNDCAADKDWLRNLIPYLTEPTVGIVGGRVIAPPPEGRVAAYEAVRSPLDMGVVGGTVGADEAVQYLPTCNVIIRRDVMLALGGFASEMRLGEDVDFIWRARQAGVAAVYAPAGRIVHYHRTSLGEFLGRRADYGSSEADLQQRHLAGRRRMLLPRLGLLLLAMLVSGFVSWMLAIAVGAAALGLLISEYFEKLRLLRRAGVRPPAPCLCRALIREHAASLYHLSANVARYYALPLIAAGLLWPPALSATAALLLAAPLADHRRLKPGLAMPTFLGLYWLDMLAYQWGVCCGCLTRRTLRPFLPKVRWGR
jgi:mycofactocin system glycosyltransferase